MQSAMYGSDGALGYQQYKEVHWVRVCSLCYIQQLRRGGWAYVCFDGVADSSQKHVHCCM
jgi:hypothetical protein